MFNETERQHALGLLDEGYESCETAAIIGCSTRSLRRWHQTWAENGTVWRDPVLRNNHADAALRNPDLVFAILTLVEAEPAAFLRDHVDLLVKLSLNYPEYDHRYVSPATVYRVLRSHDYTRNRIERLSSSARRPLRGPLRRPLLASPCAALSPLMRRTRRVATCTAGTDALFAMSGAKCWTGTQGLCRGRAP